MHAEFSVINSFVQAAVHHHNSHMLWLFFCNPRLKGKKSYLFIDCNCTANIIVSNATIMFVWGGIWRGNQVTFGVFCTYLYSQLFFVASHATN